MTTEHPDPFVRALTGRGDREVVTIERRYSASPAELWSALTDPVYRGQLALADPKLPAATRKFLNDHLRRLDLMNERAIIQHQRLREMLTDRCLSVLRFF